MRKRNFRKYFVLWVTVCMIMQMFGGIGLTLVSEASITKETTNTTTNTTAKQTKPIQSFAVSVTGSALSYTYYVGGGKANAANDGLSEDTPVTSISEITDVINQKDEENGAYTIDVLGNVTEANEIVIGNGSNSIFVTIKAVTGSAIIMRDAGYTDGDLINVKAGSKLILGDDEDSNTNELIIDGGYDSGTMTPISTGRLINIDVGAEVRLYSNTIIQNNVGPAVVPSESDDPDLIGGGIYNEGLFTMYGGEIRNNQGCVLFKI